MEALLAEDPDPVSMAVSLCKGVLSAGLARAKSGNNNPMDMLVINMIITYSVICNGPLCQRLDILR